jgi:hypothetical protein
MIKFRSLAMAVIAALAVSAATAAPATPVVAGSTVTYKNAGFSCPGSQASVKAALAIDGAVSADSKPDRTWVNPKWVLGGDEGFVIAATVAGKDFNEVWIPGKFVGKDVVYTNVPAGATLVPVARKNGMTCAVGATDGA